MRDVSQLLEAFYGYANIHRNPQAALNFNSDKLSREVVIISGTAEIAGRRAAHPGHSQQPRLRTPRSRVGRGRALARRLHPHLDARSQPVR